MANRVLDLGRRRAEAEQQPLVVELDGMRWTCPASLPASVAVDALEAVASGEASRLGPILRNLAQALFGDQAEEALRRLTVDEIMAVVNEYGVTAGESQASAPS